MFQLFSVYIPVDASQGEDQVTLFSMVGTNFVSPTPINVEGLYGIVINYIWKIKVTQIDCGFNNPLRGMYFTANTFEIGSTSSMKMFRQVATDTKL